MKERSYRLAQYEIILESSGGIWWKAHGGFADTKSGRCFIEGNVLFIGPSEVNEPGFLKREFLEYLKQFPQWDGTKYYCPSYTLYTCKGGRVQDGLHRTANTEGVRYNTAAEVINHSLSPIAGAGAGERVVIGESRRLPSESSTGRATGKIALSSLSPAAGIKHIKGKLGKAFRRCKGLVGFNAEEDESEE
jgi:hypothetical protein